MFRKFVFDIISKIVTLFFVIKYFVISDFTYNLLKALAISYLMWQEQEATVRVKLKTAKNCICVTINKDKNFL